MKRIILPVVFCLFACGPPRALELFQAVQQENWQEAATLLSAPANTDEKNISAAFQLFINRLNATPSPLPEQLTLLRLFLSRGVSLEGITAGSESLLTFAIRQNYPQDILQLIVSNCPAAELARFFIQTIITENTSGMELVYNLAKQSLPDKTWAKILTGVDENGLTLLFYIDIYKPRLLTAWAAASKITDQDTQAIFDSPLSFFYLNKLQRAAPLRPILSVTEKLKKTAIILTPEAKLYTFRGTQKFELGLSPAPKELVINLREEKIIKAPVTPQLYLYIQLASGQRCWIRSEYLSYYYAKIKNRFYSLVKKASYDQVSKTAEILYSYTLLIDENYRKIAELDLLFTNTKREKLHFHPEEVYLLYLTGAHEPEIFIRGLSVWQDYLHKTNSQSRLFTVYSWQDDKLCEMVNLYYSSFSAEGKLLNRTRYLFYKTGLSYNTILGFTCYYNQNGFTKAKLINLQREGNSYLQY